MLSIAAPFSRTAVFPAGEVSIRDIAGLYIYDNTLEAVTLTGAQVKEYLEYSAKYFNQTPVGAPVDPETLTNAGGEPDYNYDVLSGVTYDIDISKPVGSRVVEPVLRRGRGHAGRRSSWWRSTTTAARAAAASRTSARPRWSTTSRWRSARH